jgi:hypothetical protein
VSRASSPRCTARAFRDAGGWWGLLPALAVSSALHALLLFPERFGLSATDGASGASGEVGTQLAADLGALARARAEFLRAAEALVVPEAEAAPASPEAPPSAEESAPDRSLRKELAGLASETAPKEEPEREAPASASPPANEDATAQDAVADPAPPNVEPAVEPSAEPPAASLVEPSPSERERERLRAALRDPAASGGHLGAAFKRFEAQAAALRSPRRGAAGVEHGLPQLYVLAVPTGVAFLSYLELYGGEVLAHAGGERFVHFARAGEVFSHRSLTQYEVERLAAARGLNLGYVLPLDDVTSGLPEPLLAALAAARDERGAGAGTWRLFVLGTTREQAAIAAAAQEHLRHHREQAPSARLWSELERIEFRYLADERDRIYGVRIDAVHGAR